MDYQKDLKKVKSLQVGQECTVNWFEEGGGLVRCYSLDKYDLYEMGHYGSEKELHYGTFEWDDIEKMLDIAYTWT